MSAALDETHDAGADELARFGQRADHRVPDPEPAVRSVPVGRPTRPSAWRIGVAIGDQVLDLARAGLIDTDNMNELMALPRDGARPPASGDQSGPPQPEARDEAKFRESLVPVDRVTLGLPCEIGDYTDFYTSIHHATTVGKQFRPENPLLPNYKWVPIGYHGRASSIFPSAPGTGHEFRRPLGQTKAPDAPEPSVGPSRRMDYELELGAFVSRPNAIGEPIPISEAEEHIFGLALFNDWTARDIQPWEYQPLGPFLSKNFASTVSPWIVTLDALAPFRDAVRPARAAIRLPCPIWTPPENRAHGGLDIDLEVWLQTAQMRAAGTPATA